MSSKLKSTKSTSVSSTSPSTPPSPSQDWAVALSAVFVSAAHSQLDKMLAAFTHAVSIQCKIDVAILAEIWSRVAPECAGSLSVEVDAQNKRKETSLKKIQKKDVEAKGPFCAHYFKESKTRPEGGTCAKYCKDHEEDESGKTFCAVHKKQAASKHTCCFLHSGKARKAGQECGARVQAEEQFDDEGLVEAIDGYDYQGKWLCKRHIDAVMKRIKQRDHQCSHVYGPTSNKDGERCPSAETEGGKCSKHQGGKKEKIVKKGKASTEVEEDDESSSSSAAPKPVVKAPKTPAKKKKAETPEDEGEKDKLTVKINFKLAVNGQAREPKFQIISRVNDEDETFKLFVDKSSGIVCINEKNPLADAVALDDMKAIGIWDNSEQSYVEMNDAAVQYAILLGVQTPEEDDE